MKYDLKIKIWILRFQANSIEDILNSDKCAECVISLDISNNRYSGTSYKLMYWVKLVY